MRTQKAIPHIQVGKDYRISWDGLNITLLYHCKPRKAGQDGAWRPIGYYSTFKDALEGLVDTAVKSPDLKNIAEVAKKQDELYRLIQNLKTSQGFEPQSSPDLPESLYKGNKPPAGSKPLARKKRGLKLQKGTNDIVGRKAVVEMLNEGNGKGKRKRRKGGQ